MGNLPLSSIPWKTFLITSTVDCSEISAGNFHTNTYLISVLRVGRLSGIDRKLLLPPPATPPFFSTLQSPHTPCTISDLFLSVFFLWTSNGALTTTCLTMKFIP